MSTLDTAGSFAQQYNLSDYIPPVIQSSITVGENVYNGAQAVSQSGITIGPHGSINMSDSARQEAYTYFDAAFTAANPALGAALAIFMAVAPKAGSGPGVCATNPPVSSSPSDLVAWPYFTSWESFFGPYPKYPAGSFESFANPSLEYNWLLFSNCFGDSPHYMAPSVLLGLLINAWNSKHSPSVQRTISRTGLNPPGFSPENATYDPIANALENAALAKATQAVNSQPGLTFEQAIAATSAAPNNISSSFVINDGPLVLKALTLHFPGSSGTAATLAPGAASPTVSAGPSTAKRVAVGAVIVVGAGALGVGAWALATHQSYLGALKGVWRSSGGKVISKVRKINPLPVAMETFAEKSTRVQTLLFPRSRYSESRAKAWALAHSYHVSKAPDVTANYIRIRQKPPSDFEKNSFRTISLGKSGVRAVVGHLR